MSNHIMITRSKTINISDSSSDEELDSDGNLKDFIVNDLRPKNKIKKMLIK